MIQELAVFAAKFGVSPKDAHVLPALFERAAQIAGMPTCALLSRATYSNFPLGEYLAKAARQVADEDRTGGGQ